MTRNGKRQLVEVSVMGMSNVYRPCSDAYNFFSEKINAVKVVTLTNV